MRPWRLEPPATNGLFADLPALGGSVSIVDGKSHELSHGTAPTNSARLDTLIGENVAAVFERAKNPRDAAELCALYIGKAESALGRSAVRPNWRNFGAPLPRSARFTLTHYFAIRH